MSKKIRKKLGIANRAILCNEVIWSNDIDSVDWSGSLVDESEIGFSSGYIKRVKKMIDDNTEPKKIEKPEWLEAFDKYFKLSSPTRELLVLNKVREIIDHINKDL